MRFFLTALKFTAVAAGCLFYAVASLLLGLMFTVWWVVGLPMRLLNGRRK